MRRAPTGTRATPTSRLRLPWLRALAGGARAEPGRVVCTSWTTRNWNLGEPDEGDAAPCRHKFGMKVTAPLAFASEHRRGWSETDDSPPRDARGACGTNGSTGSRCASPARTRRPPTDLTARGYYAAFRSKLPSDDFDFGYDLRIGDTVVDLPDVQWADWSADGRLLVATTDGRLQVRAGDPGALEVVWEADLTPFEPDPQRRPVRRRNGKPRRQVARLGSRIRRRIQSTAAKEHGDRARRDQQHSDGEPLTPPCPNKIPDRPGSERLGVRWRLGQRRIGEWRIAEPSAAGGGFTAPSAQHWRCTTSRQRRRVGVRPARPRTIERNGCDQYAADRERKEQNGRLPHSRDRTPQTCGEVSSFS